MSTPRRELEARTLAYHQLRTPLDQARGAVRRLLQTDPSEEQRRLMMAIGDSIEAMQGMIDGLGREPSGCDDEPAPAAPVASGSGPSASSPALRVLVVEDDQINRMVAVGMLEELGCRVDAAKDGVDGLRCAKERVYDVIFMDCRMPRMDGFETTVAIREQVEYGSRVPIIAMTAHAMTHDRARCLSEGMNDYISKPVTRGTLSAVIRHYGGTKRIERDSPVLG